MANKINFSEVFAKNVLQQFYYKDFKLIIGDNYSLRLPDIYDSSRLIGIEVGQAEIAEDFLQESINCALGKNSKTSAKNLNNQNILPHSFFNKPLIKKYVKNIAILPNYDIVAFFPTPKARNFKEEIPIFLDLIKDKIKRARKGNYTGCKEINLCVVSIYRIRDLPLIKKLAKEIKRLEQTEFNKIFIILSSSLFVINKDCKVNIFDYSDQEFSRLHLASKCEHKTLNKTNKLKKLNK